MLTVASAVSVPGALQSGTKCMKLPCAEISPAFLNTGISSPESQAFKCWGSNMGPSSQQVFKLTIDLAQNNYEHLALPYVRLWIHQGWYFSDRQWMRSKVLSHHRPAENLSCKCWGLNKLPSTCKESTGLPLSYGTFFPLEKSLLV